MVISTRFSIALLVVFTAVSCFSQAKFPSITFEKPANWIERTDFQRQENLQKYEFSDEQLTKQVEIDKTSRFLAVIYRDDPKKVAGIIPTIQVLIRPLPNITFERFKTTVVSSLFEAGAVDNLKLVGDVETPTVSGVRSVMFNTTFDLKAENLIYTIRNRNYAIPRGKYFIQISMSDENDEDWTETEFSAFIESVKIGK